MIVTGSLLPPDPPRQREEAALQRSIVQFARWALPNNALQFAVPNGGLRSKRVAAQLAAEGVKAGVPDLFVMHACGALGIEVKIKNTYPSAVQKQMHQKLALCGIDTVIVRSLDEWIAAVEAFGVHLLARPT